MADLPLTQKVIVESKRSLVQKSYNFIFFKIEFRATENFTKSACKFLVEVIVYESLQRFGSCPVVFFFSSAPSVF